MGLSKDPPLPCMTSRRSFQNLDKWLSELRENTDPSVVVALVGTKTDLASQRQVASERAQSYARSNGLLYVETSAYWNKYEGGEKLIIPALMVSFCEEFCKDKKSWAEIQPGLICLATPRQSVLRKKAVHQINAHANAPGDQARVCDWQ
eukprot:s2394_g5.t1